MIPDAKAIVNVAFAAGVVYWPMSPRLERER